MSEHFIIKGGKTLRGEIEARGAKNACFPILAATLLTKEDCEIDNIPLIEDIFRFIELLESLGKKIEWKGGRDILVKHKSDIDVSKIRKDLITKLRGSVLLFGPLLAITKSLEIPQPGGCVIGARPITTHLDAFQQLGAKLSIKVVDNREYFDLCLGDKINNEIVLNEFSVTATENVLLFCAGLAEEVVIKVADCDYPTQELIKFLNKMGAEIEEYGPHAYKIKGNKKLKGVKHKVIGDPIEAGTFILMAAATKSTITIKNVELKYLEFPIKRLIDFGLPITIIDNNSVKVEPWALLRMEKVQALPYPGIPTDLLPLFGVLATQTEGTTLLHDPLYDGRLKYLNELNKMGAEIIFADPHRAIVNGPSKLRGVVVDSPDLRGGASLIVGALLADGETIVNNIYQIDRGYERIEERLQGLGADIKRIKE